VAASWLLARNASFYVVQDQRGGWVVAYNKTFQQVQTEDDRALIRNVLVIIAVVAVIVTFVVMVPYRSGGSLRCRDILHDVPCDSGTIRYYEVGNSCQCTVRREMEEETNAQ
jgi:hypothetical protein